MRNTVVVEICVESLDRAQASQRGGADRIELCRSLSIGGVTPNAALMRTVRTKVSIPIYILIRPRAGDFVYSDLEFETMKRDLDIVKELGMDGIVLGILDHKQRVDIKRTSKLVKLAHPLPVTFHRAFDLCSHPAASLEAVIETGAKRLLTSGRKANAIDGLTSLARFVALAEDRIVIMPGGGVRVSNVKRILRQTGAREIHSSLGTSRKVADRTSDPADATPSFGTRPAMEFETRVSKFRRSVDAVVTNTNR